MVALCHATPTSTNTLQVQSLYRETNIGFQHAPMESDHTLAAMFTSRTVRPGMTKHHTSEFGIHVREQRAVIRLLV